MPSPIHLAINGASGRMGRALLALLREDPRFELARAVVSPGSPHLDTPVYGDRPAALRFAHELDGKHVDVVIDFSGISGLAQALRYCVANKVALVTGTTGIDAGLEAELDAASKQIPILYAANFSLGGVEAFAMRSSRGSAGLGPGNH